MKDHRSSLNTLPENLTFDHGSISSDIDIDPQLSWNSIPTSEWSFGESSSNVAQNHRNERKTSFRSRSSLSLENQHFEPSNILSFDINNVDLSSNESQTTNGSFLLQNSSLDTLSQDLNMTSVFEDHEDDDCQIVEPPTVGLSNGHVPCGGGPSNSFGMPSGYLLEREDMPGCSLDGQRMSRKRKALEISVRPSAVSSLIATSNFTTPTQTENTIFTSNVSGQGNPSLRLGVREAVSESPISLTPSVNNGNSRRNIRLRLNGSHHQEPSFRNPFLPEANTGNENPLSSRLNLRNNLLGLNPHTLVETGTPHGQSVRNPRTRWSGPSSSRTIPRAISENPMFVHAAEIPNSSQNPTNLNMASGNNSIASNWMVGSSSGFNPPGPTWSHRNNYASRRLPGIVQRSLVSSSTESGGQSSNHGLRSSPSLTAQEMALLSGSNTRGLHTPTSRSAFLERNPDGALGIPASLRSLASVSEGRSGIMSEIRHVLNLMRRGESVRFEDMMFLDNSVLVGMAGVHDRHRDMRLDVDNMSYEELLALEERIGNVCTGLTEETITSHLKHHKFIGNKSGKQLETEPCSICREEYNDGENLGTLECGHDFHNDCIKQWLGHKNLCPICKKTGLTTTT